MQKAYRLWFVARDEESAKEAYPFDSYEGAWRLKRNDPENLKIYSAIATVDFTTLKEWTHGQSTG